MPSERMDTDTDINLADIIRIIMRRKMVFIITFSVVMGLVAAYLLLAKWKYRADSDLQVLKEDSSSSITDLISSAGGASDALSVNLTLQTYVGVLTSDNLALRVIKELDLEDTSEYKTSIGYFDSDEAMVEMLRPLQDTRFRRVRVLARFKSNLKVSVVSGTRLINVSFLSTDPALAKRVLDQLLKDFIEYNFQVRYNATKVSSAWLGDQLTDLEGDVEDKQTTVAQLQRQTGIFGSDETHNIVLSRLEALNQQLMLSEQNRIVKDAVRQVMRSGDPELISNLSGTASQALTPGAVNSLALIQSLRQQEAQLNAQLADLTSKYGDNYPRVAEMREQLAASRRSIQNESARLQERANSDYQVAAAQEKEIRDQFESQKALANQKNDLSIQYGIAKREATSTRDLYENLTAKLKEAGVLAGLRSTNIDVVDPAHVGTTPASPAILLTIGLGIVFGTILGLSAVFLRDSLDRSLYKPEDVELLTDLALLGVVPLVQQEELNETASSKEQIAAPPLPSQANPITYMAASHPNSVFSEALRTIRTALLLSAPDRRLQVIMVTSPLPSEGKSTIAANLASIMAQQGKKVLLVDADMRRGTLSRSLGVAARIGLSQKITTQDDEQVLPVPLAGTPNLFLIPAGAHPPYPSELLASEAAARLLLKWRAEYDFILFDTPPVLPVTDAVAFSARVDGVILVSRAAVTTKQSFQRAFSLLQNVQAPLLGAVFNAMDVHSSEYAHFSGYYRYSSQYGYSYGGYGDKQSKTGGV